MKQPISRDTIWDLLVADHWSPQHNDPLEMAFRCGRDMPEGFWREAVITPGFTAHTLQMWVVAFNGERLPLAQEVSFQTEMDLMSYVAQLGPASFSHVIQPFAQQQYRMRESA